MKARPQAPLPAAPQPFRRPVDVRRLPEGGMQQLIEADAAERAQLAAAIGLPAVKALTGRFELRRRAGDRVALTGRVDAEVTQLCVVTLEPFDSTLSQAVDLTFAPAQAEPGGVSRRRGRDGEAMPRPVPGSDDQADPPEPIINELIDLGAVATEFLVLALDPYPRRPGVSFDDIVDAGDAEEPSAFAALESLKARP